MSERFKIAKLQQDFKELNEDVKELEKQIGIIGYDVTALKFSIRVLYKQIYPEVDHGEIPTYPSKEHEGL